MHCAPRPPKERGEKFLVPPRFGGLGGRLRKSYFQQINIIFVISETDSRSLNRYNLPGKKLLKHFPII